MNGSKKPSATISVPASKYVKACLDEAGLFRVDGDEGDQKGKRISNICWP
jgi:hypothetical protein